MRRTAQRLLAEYGAAAVVVHFTLFFAVFFGAWAAIAAGWQPASLSGKATGWMLAYLFTKLTQPVRIAATVALTPIVARLWERLTGWRAAAAPLPVPAPLAADVPRVGPPVAPVAPADRAPAA